LGGAFALPGWFGGPFCAVRFVLQALFYGFRFGISNNIPTKTKNARPSDYSDDLALFVCQKPIHNYSVITPI
jgi:hypothetical protein